MHETEIYCSNKKNITLTITLLTTLTKALVYFYFIFLPLEFKSRASSIKPISIIRVNCFRELEYKR